VLRLDEGSAAVFDVLKGLRIVEGSAFVAAPSGGMMLAQLGADVIRFDQIGGGIDHDRWPVTPEGRSMYWTGLNKGKRSFAVDLRSERGRELCAELVCAPGDGAGIFLSNFPARGWMSYEALKERRDDLIMVNIKGNRDGTTAVDYTVNCAVGYPFVTGPDSSASPANHVLPAWDVICGQMTALGLLAAERTRSREGTGQLVEIALADVAMWTVAMLGHIAEAQINREERSRIGNDMYGAFGRDFVTKEGRRVMAVAISFRQWQGLLDAMGLQEKMKRVEELLEADFRKEGDRFEHRAVIASVMEPWFRAQTVDQIRTAFDARSVCWGPYQTFRQLVDEDPRCSVENPMFQMVDQPGIGRYLMAGPPLDFSGSERGEVAPAPALGEHTDQILAEELELSSAEIGRLHDDGVVAGPEH
jgi:2-methylfumaryl-CoA isomerase